MKIIFPLIGLCLVMAGCNEGIDGKPKNIFYKATVAIDPETGCQYLIAGSGLYPRLNSDGKPMCKKSN